MAKLKVGDIFRYKGQDYDFISKLTSAEPQWEGKTSYRHTILSIKKGGFAVGASVHSSSEEDEHITIIRKKGIKTLKTKTPDKRSIELKIRKI